MKRILALCLCIGLAGTMACVDGENEDDPVKTGETSLNLIADYDAKNDVVGFRYNIKRVACSKYDKNFDPYWVVKDLDKSLLDLTLPGGISTFENRPFSEDSTHQFADFLTLVKAGCYDVSVQPLKRLGSHGKPAKISRDCRIKVSKKGVKVVAGKTTEILLISQCEGGERGALDVIAALNHPPTIVELDYKSTHFLKCKYGPQQVQVKVCAQATDPDGDPMNFYWGQKWGPEIGDDQPVVDFSKQIKNTKTECVTYTLPELEEGQADYLLTLSVYDKFVDKYGNLVHAEDWINDAFYKGKKGIESHDKIKFPVRLICKDVDKITLENSVFVTSDEDDINPDNNTDTVTVTVKDYKNYCEYPGGNK